MWSKKVGAVANVVVLCMVVMEVSLSKLPHAAVAAVTCEQVSLPLAPCINYLVNGGAVPFSCCNGVSAVNNAAKTTPDRQATCRCLKSLAKSIPGIKPDNAAKLPDLCDVKVPYPISSKTDCSKVK